jgi:nitroreductase
VVHPHTQNVKEPTVNPALAHIFHRRSVRCFTSDAVPDALVRDLLDAAMAAPSARATDPWRFVVLRDQAVRRAIAAKLPNGSMLAQAPLGIAICGELSAACDQQLSYLIQDCSAAMANLLLAADALGLGACWLGVHPREDRVAHLRTTLGLPDGILPIAAVAVGWPAESPAPRTRFDSAKVHGDRW